MHDLEWFKEIQTSAKLSLCFKLFNDQRAITQKLL